MNQNEHGSMKPVPRNATLLQVLEEMCTRIEILAVMAHKPEKKARYKLIALQSAPGVGKSFALWLIASLGQLTERGLEELIGFGFRHKTITDGRSFNQVKDRFSKILKSVGLTITFNFGLDRHSEENGTNFDEFLGWRLLFR